MISQTLTASDALDLSGEWVARPDPQRRGEPEAWFRADLADGEGSATVRLPGSAQTQGIGAAPDVTTEWVGAAADHPFYTDEAYAPYRGSDDFRIPFWLQPKRVYVGAVWYQRTFVLGADRAGSDMVLTLERVHWESTVWLDDVRIGSARSLSAPHRFVLPDPGPGEHRITLRIDNAMIVDVGTNAHSVSDHTQGGWNGVIGEISIRPLAPVRIASLEVHPDLDAGSAAVRATVEVGSLGGCRGTLTITASPRGGGETAAPAPLIVPVEVSAERFSRGRATTSGHIDAVLALGDDARRWDEFDPALYELEAVLDATSEHGRSIDARTTVFGMRSVGVSGTRIAVNGRPTFLRGTLDCCVFPLTGYPPTDRDSWARIFETCRSYGLNHIRFHSWCPPEAAFDAADELGLYLQVEGPIWANQGASIGRGGDVDAFLYEESEAIVREYGNHPSFLLMAHGNEPEGRDAEFLGQWVAHWRRRDARRLYTSAAGWPAVPENDFDCVPDARIQAWGEGLDSRINARAPETLTEYSAFVEGRSRPTVTHEAGQWCAYPNIAEIDKYSGIMKARNIEIVRDLLDRRGLLDQAADIHGAAGRLQVLCYKEEIEALLRTDGLAGVQLLGLSDFPGQGTAPVGVLDAFWEEKGYVDAAEFSRFCASTVPLARLATRVWRASERLVADVRIAHYGRPGVHADIEWQLVADDGATIAAGAFPGVELAIGSHDHGRIDASFGRAQSARHLRLVIAVVSEEGRFENDWDLWTYPDASPAEPLDDRSPVVTRSAAEAVTALAAGATVLLVPPSHEIASPVEFGFSTVFWNTSWTEGQPPHTLGILCDPSHPAFGDFPTGAHTDWQWWELLNGARPVDLTALPHARPIVQVIDSWFDARRLGLLVEARVGPGRLLLCGMDVLSDLDDRIVARQLLGSLVSYLRRDAAEPPLELAPADVPALLGGQLTG